MVVFGFIILLFFLHSVPDIQNLSFGWAALIGLMAILILTAQRDIDQCLHQVEWSTLLFFAALFILMECLTKLGLITYIGLQTERIIESVDSKDARLAVALILIVWVSGFMAAFVDNIPLTSMMIKIIVSLSQNEKLGLPLSPMVFALAFASGIGGKRKYCVLVIDSNFFFFFNKGNGTLIGSSSNIVCAGVAEQHGHKITFGAYIK